MFKIKKVFFYIASAFFLVVFLYSTYEVIRFYKTDYLVQKELNYVNDIANIPKNIKDTSFLFNNISKDVSHYRNLNINFKKLLLINPDIVAWICIPGTEINFPIVKGKDNNHYLNYTFSGQKHYVGSIFMDYRNSSNFSDLNTIIYGHHISNGRMFSDIKKFNNKDFFQNHPFLFIYTPTKTYECSIYSIHIKEYSSEMFDIQFNSSNEFETYINQTIDNSNFNRNITINRDNKLVTLTTCVSGKNKDLRYLLHATMKEI